jgi:hypothetical protein
MRPCGGSLVSPVALGEVMVMRDLTGHWEPANHGDYLYLAPLSGFPFAHEDLTWMGSTVTAGSQGTRPQEPIKRPDVRMDARPVPVPPRRPVWSGRPANRRPMECFLFSCVRWLAARSSPWAPRSPSEVACERHVGGWGHVARAVRAGAGGRRRRRSPAVVLSATRGALGPRWSVFTSLFRVCHYKSS